MPLRPRTHAHAMGSTGPLAFPVGEAFPMDTAGGRRGLDHYTAETTTEYLAYRHRQGAQQHQQDLSPQVAS